MNLKFTANVTLNKTTTFARFASIEMNWTESISVEWYECYWIQCHQHIAPLCNEILLFTAHNVNVSMSFWEKPIHSTYNYPYYLGCIHMYKTNRLLMKIHMNEKEKRSNRKKPTANMNFKIPYGVRDEVRTTRRSLNWPTIAINQCKIKRYRHRSWIPHSICTPKILCVFHRHFFPSIFFFHVYFMLCTPTRSLRQIDRMHFRNDSNYERYVYALTFLTRIKWKKVLLRTVREIHSNRKRGKKDTKQLMIACFCVLFVCYLLLQKAETSMDDAKEMKIANCPKESKFE